MGMEGRGWIEGQKLFLLPLLSLCVVGVTLLQAATSLQSFRV